MRWKIRSAGTESGSNNGSDLWVEAFADDGTTKINDPIWISRTTGQVAIGIADSSQGGVKLSVNGAIGTRDVAGDPPTTTMGAQLYSKAGKLWVQTASGAEKFQVVNSVAKAGNNQIDGQYVWLNTAAGSYRAFGYKTAGVDRWLFQVDDAAESGSNAGSNFRLSARNDDGSFNKTTVYASRATGQITFGTTVLHGDAQTTSASAIGIRDQAADPATTTGGVFLYSKSGVAYVKQADGTIFQLGAGGGGGAVSSVNGYTGVVTLAASDVGALKANDAAYQTNTRAIFQGDGTNNIMEWRNPTGGLAARIGANGNFVGQGAAYMAGGLQVGASSTNWGGGSGAMLGLNDAATIPSSNPTAGLVAYSEGGVLKVRQSDGTIVTVANNPTIPVTSVNTKTGAVSLTASDVGAVPISGGTVDNGFGINAPTGTSYGSLNFKKLGVNRWTWEVTGSSETGSNAGSDIGLARYADDGTEIDYPVLLRRSSGSMGLGTNTLATGAKLTVSGGSLVVANQSDPGATTTGAAFYSKSGLPYIKRSSGAPNGEASSVFEVQPRPSEFLPEDLGLVAWTSDPMDCLSTGAFTGTTNARVASVYLREPQTITKIVWHFTGYAGGLLANSWAAIYDSAGVRKAYNDSIYTGANEPAEQHDLGGGTSFVPVTSTTLPAGLYYIVWRFNYTTSPADGPMCLQYENSAGAPSNVFGLNNAVRFGVLDAASQNTSYSSLTIANIQRGANRFWAALA
jgi:hypothetical protein